MDKDFKVFGVGVTKTGTTTLGACFEILQITPHATFNRELRAVLRRGGDREVIFAEADRYRGFEDAPWFELFAELDERSPRSKFILTTRLDSTTRALSV